VVEIGFEEVESQGFAAMSEKIKPLPVSAEKAAKMPKLLARITAKDSIQVANKRSAGNADLWDGVRSYYHSWYA
jgi:hypothetical protein